MPATEQLAGRVRVSSCTKPATAMSAQQNSGATVGTGSLPAAQAEGHVGGHWHGLPES